MVATVTASKPRNSRRQVVFSFDEGQSASRSVLGGKGAHLADMTALGLPVPAGFTVSTTVARASSQHGRLPNRVIGQIDRALMRLERQTGKRFGDPESPLLVSVRSGAAASMPGMMDTILNLGLTAEIVEELAIRFGSNYASDIYQTFLRQFGQVVLGVASDEPIDAFVDQVPTTPREQLFMAVDAVHKSWQSERAIAYRNANNLPHWWGTAVNVQAMVFGNLGDLAGTGVVFSHDLTTGQRGLNGEFLFRAQGEELVSGVRTPQPVADLETLSPSLYTDLEHYVMLLADHLGDAVDVEFTIENGRLYLLQVRSAKRSPRAAVTIAVHKVWAKQLTRHEAVASIPQTAVKQLRTQSLEQVNSRTHPVIATGLPASAGAAVGFVAYSLADVQWLVKCGTPAILVARDTTPDDLPAMLAASAIITANGGATCHAAVVARELGLPAVVGIGLDAYKKVNGRHGKVSVDGTSGTVYLGSVPLVQNDPTKEENIFMRWVESFAPKPEIGFEYIDGRESANSWLNDFYLTDAMARKSVGTTLEQEATDLREKTHRLIAQKFAAYLMLAIAEVRHVFEPDRFRGDSRPYEELRTVYSVVEGFVRTPTQTGVQSVLKSAPREAQQRFFTLSTAAFSADGWNGSFGGKKWADIAHAVEQYLSGALSPTLFVDHAFDLRHNGGALFDKHSMVDHTLESNLKKQLDIKKEHGDPSALFYKLAYYGEFDDAVEDLFFRGVGLILW